jgi:hypothetical protein
MINNEMRLYNYYTFGTYDEYGKPILTEQPQGTIKMAIYTLTQTTQNNPMYENSTYIGLTADSKVNNTYVIEYEGNRLKVLYIQPKGKFKQVFLSNG